MVGLEVGETVEGDDIIGMVDGVATFEAVCAAFLRTNFLLYIMFLQLIFDVCVWHYISNCRL